MAISSYGMGLWIKLVSFKSHFLRLKYTRAYKAKDVDLVIQQHWCDLF